MCNCILIMLNGFYKGVIMLADNLTVTIDHVSNMIDKGYAFRAFVEFTIPAKSGGVDGEYSFSVKTGEQVAVLYNRIIDTDQPNIRYEVRTGAVTTNLREQVEVRPQNPKNVRPVDVDFYRCDYTDAGELSDLDPLPGQAGSGSNASGDIYTASEPKPIPENTESLIVFKNPNNVECKALLYYKWYHIGANAWD